jgi:membrane protein
VLLFGATGVFGELQDAFELLWSHGAPRAQAGWRHTAALRLRGIGYILVFGFLLLVSLVVSTLLTCSRAGPAPAAAGDRAARAQRVLAFVVCAACSRA